MYGGQIRARALESHYAEVGCKYHLAV
jgi:hypothetical protein